VGALAQKDVGDYLNKYFVSSYQKISTFTLTSKGQKQGGNVASYFCTADGRVLHAVAGPVSGAKLLEEARWVEETCKLAELHDIKTFVQIQKFFRAAHVDRLAKEFNLNINAKQLPGLEPSTASTMIQGPYVKSLLNQSGDQQAKVHLLLAVYSTPKLARVYATVFELILNQEISNVPVVQRG
jgi:hypothetical protein